MRLLGGGSAPHTRLLAQELRGAMRADASWRREARRRFSEPAGRCTAALPMARSKASLHNNNRNSAFEAHLRLSTVGVQFVCWLMDGSTVDGWTTTVQMTCPRGTGMVRTELPGYGQERGDRGLSELSAVTPKCRSWRNRRVDGRFADEHKTHTSESRAHARI